MKKRRAYDFATIGFRPDATREFVTIGVMAMDTQAYHFGFALLDARKTKRIHDMFPAAKRLYKQARKDIEVELNEIEKAINGIFNRPHVPFQSEDERELFAVNAEDRNGVICYPVKGCRTATGMVEVLRSLKKRFVSQ